MAVKSSQIRASIRVIAYLYLTFICLLWLWDNYAAGFFNWIMTSFILLFAAGFFLRRKWLEKLIGLLAMTGGFYMLMAVLSAYQRANDAGHHVNAMYAVKFGIPMFGLCFLSGSALIIISSIEARPKKIE